MAGLGEACTHIATLLFAIDATVKMRDSKTVTQEPAYWLLPAARREIHYREVGEIDFTSAQTKRKNLEESIASGLAPSPLAASPRVREPRKVIPPSDAELETFFHGLSLGDTKPAVLSLVSPYSDGYIPKQAQIVFPEMLRDLVREDHYKKPFNIVLEHSMAVKLAVCSEQIEAVEKATRAQSNSRLWPLFRAGRVTASKFRTVCHTDPSQPAASCIKGICYPDRHLTTPAMRWGIKHEKCAKAAYVSRMMAEHVNIYVRDSGFVIHREYPEIGASPDGVTWCDCHGEGSLEVKCPYILRDEDITTASEGATCLSKDTDGNLKLRVNHAYYYQVQCQLFVCGHAYGDFVVWTQRSCHCERIAKDDKFWEEMLPKARHFFRVGLLPELLGKCHTRPPLVGCPDIQTDSTASVTAVPVWCYCRKEESGDMVACDSGSCKYEWFHFACVGLLSEPKGKWFCPECRKEKRKERIQKR